MNCAMEKGKDHSSEHHLLGGRVRLRQLREGYRAGLDAVLLAASVPAAPDQQVLDLGTGAGAVSLCLMARVKDARLTGVEIDEGMAALARANAALNGWDTRFSLVHDDIARRGLLSGKNFDHVMANPPFHEAHRHRLPRLEQRARALIEGEAGLNEWIGFALKRLKPDGSLTFILRADRLAQALAALGGSAGRILVFPVFPRPNTPAIRIVVQALKGRRSPLQLLPGLTLLDDADRQSAAARRILEDGEALPLAIA